MGSGVDSCVMCLEKKGGDESFKNGKQVALLGARLPGQVNALLAVLHQPSAYKHLNVRHFSVVR